MNVKKTLQNRIRGWLPKTPNLPKQPPTPHFKKTEFIDEKGVMNQNFPAKPSNSFLDGMAIGGSLAVLLAGLLLWSSLNSIYWTQRNAFIMSGVDVNQINYIFLDMVFAIDFCAVAVVLSSYLLIYTSARRLNPTIRTLLDNKTKLKWANGCLGGGIVGVTFSVQNIVLSYYPSSSPNPIWYSIGFGVVGPILMVAGVLWIAISYRKTRKQLVKV